jgi:hypothetical protein
LGYDLPPVDCVFTDNRFRTPRFCLCAALAPGGVKAFVTNDKKNKFCCSMKKLTDLIIMTVVFILSYSGVNPLTSAPFDGFKKKVIIKETDSVSVKSLTKIDLNKYVGKKVSLFLNDPLISKYKDYVFIDGKPGSLLFLTLEYSPHLYIEVYVKKFSHTKPFDIKMAWKLDTYKKEVLREIRIKLNRLILKDTNKRYENQQVNDPVG